MRAARAMGIGGAVALLAGVGDRLLVGSGRARWGATDEETRTPLPGDDLVGEPAAVTTRAVTIRAAAAGVWGWLAQIGQERAGLYGYRVLGTPGGRPVDDLDEIREEWQRPVAGDRVHLVAPGRLGDPEGYGYRVTQVEPGRALVLQRSCPGRTATRVWSFHVLPVDGDTCRLVARTRTPRPSGATGPVAGATGAALALVQFLIERRLLLGIRERAEWAAVVDRVTRPSTDPGSAG